MSFTPQMKMPSTDQHKYRTMIRVLRVIDSPDGVFVEARILAWNPHRVAILPISIFPEDLIDIIECSPGPDEARIYLHARLDMNAETSKTLNIEGPWELDKMANRVDDPERQVCLGHYAWDEEGKPQAYGSTKSFI